MKMRAFLLVALFALGACASTQRTLSYNAGMPDADVYVGEQRFQVWFHERDQTVLVVRGDSQPLGVLLAQNMTVYANDRTLGILWWGAAANAVLTQFGWHLIRLDARAGERDSAVRAMEHTHATKVVKTF